MNDEKNIVDDKVASEIPQSPESKSSENSTKVMNKSGGPSAPAKKKAGSSKKTQPTNKKAPTKTLATKRPVSPFPAVSFEEALTIANAIQKHAGGTQRVRRVTLFDALDKSPDSGTSRQLVTNSGRYGLTTGGYQAEFLELTADGNAASNPEATERERRAARFRLAIEQIAPFKALYERLKGNRLATISVLEDIAKENGVPEEFARECVETFIVNARFVEILRTLSGAERVVSIEQVLEELPSSPISSRPMTTRDNGSEKKGEGIVPSKGEWDTTCFYITPIGSAESEHRLHSDLFLGSIVEPALEEFQLTVVRADQIGKPGMITSQIIEYILRSKLVIADLSFHNPNVFYELALRHMCRLPIVQIIRTKENIPFDLGQFRTIQIDTTDIYSLVPRLQTYKAEIATQVRAALTDPDSVDNPVSTYYPELRVTF